VQSNSFDIDSVTKDLRKENVRDICCINIPAECNYADYMLIGTCLSERHMNATFINLNKKFKKSNKKKADRAYLGFVVPDKETVDGEFFSMKMVLLLL
jgi:ribosomal silencing factor RsfS